MAYNENIPQATDKLSVSQGNILDNFIAIKALVDVNHEDFAVAAQGKHKKIDFTDQSANLPITAAATTKTMYLATEIAPFVALGQQLYLKSPAGVRIPITGANASQGGFTYLPSGVIIAWATVNVGTAAPNFVAAHFNNIPLSTATFGASFPGFANGFTAQLTYQSVAVNSGYVAFAVALNNTTLQVSNNVVGSQPLNILVIGN